MRFKTAFMYISVCVLGCFSFLWAGESCAAIKVMVSIAPQEYFVRKIGAGLVEVLVMVPPGASPATYEPKPRQMVAVAESAIYFAIGVPFESAWLKRIIRMNPRMRVVHTEEGIEKLPMKARLEYRQRRERRDLESSGGLRDPHVWLSPPLVIIQARNIMDAFCRVDPAHAQTYEANYRDFVEELVGLDLKIRKILMKRPRGFRFMVYHPSWGYFARAYGLEQVPIELEGKEPTIRELKSLIRFAKNNGIRIIFAQPQFSLKSATAIASSLGGRVVVADPLAPNWAENLLKVAGEFRKALR